MLRLKPKDKGCHVGVGVEAMRKYALVGLNVGAATCRCRYVPIAVGVNVVGVEVGVKVGVEVIIFEK